MGVKVFLARGSKEKVLVINDELGSNRRFWRGSTGAILSACYTNTKWKGARFEVRIEVGVYVFSRKK